ncbi:MAG: D-alanyl-D-alanine carboxypeptidase/D-alanyl-D-alanine-endopeptidase [Acidobacteriia bacterium]|nr:D-alanyl-D-alanine carboxypeptidase/D-alanyl-D-alanine-endopeptidase [Terriglobia bacterium]
MSFARFLVALVLASDLFAVSLEDEIAQMIQASPVARNAFWGIAIADLSTGNTLYSLNADRLFIPASNTKLFTAALALERLGPDFRFQTRVLSSIAPDSEGVIPGAVTLVGAGDPNLSARLVPYDRGPASGDPLAPLEDLAGQVASRGVTRISGGIVADDTWYVWEPYPEGWTVDDTRYDYGAPVSALTINDNTFLLNIQPGASTGSLAELALVPPVEYYLLDNRIRTVAAAGERNIQVSRDPRSRQLLLWGSIPLRAAPETLAFAIDDPAEYAARAFRRALQNRGITVNGGFYVRHRFPNEETSDPSGFELAHRDSAPLIEDLGITAKVSQNLHAELALRAVARAREGLGSRAAGLQEMKLFLEEIGVSPEAYSFGDASGLDRSGLVSPSAVITLLRYMYDSPAREPWIALLPVAGQDGTLSARFGSSPAAGRIYAKTGSLSHVAALSGYARKPDGTWLAFSILVNNFNGPVAEVHSIIDRICTLIME